MPIPHRFHFLLLAIVMCGYLFGGAVASADNLDINVFVNELAPFGQWIESDQYGKAWIPTGTPKDWRPYTDGRWAWIEEYGWTWVSDYEWGWAPFHYGRWLNDARHGWMWIPDTQWAPAWVAWRTDDTHVGWAPLPPAVRFNAGSPLRLSDRALDKYIARDAWSFVRRQQFVEPNLRQHVLPRATVLTLLPKARSVTYYAPTRAGVANRSIELSFIEKAIGAVVPRLRIARVDRFEDYKARRSDAGQVYIYDPWRKAVKAKGDRKREKESATSLVQVPVEKPRMEVPRKPIERKQVHGRPNHNLKSKPSMDKQRGKDRHDPMSSSR